MKKKIGGGILSSLGGVNSGRGGRGRELACSIQACTKICPVNSCEIRRREAGPEFVGSGAGGGEERNI